MLLRENNDILGKIAASDMADALIRSCGWDLAVEKVQAHILRCIETNQEDEAVFWACVRNVLDHLMSAERNADDRLH